MSHYAQFCALARAAEVVGERWTLLILRELYLGPKRFSDLKERLDPIAPGVLNGRLRSLSQRGIISRRDVPPPTPARVYELTDAGRALEPALFELLRWGARYLFPQRGGERFEPDWFRMVLTAYAQDGPVEQVRIGIAVRDEQGSAIPVATISGARGIVEVGPFATGTDAEITGSPVGLLGLMSGRVNLSQCEADGQISVSGDQGAAALMPSLFRARS